MEYSELVPLLTKHVEMRHLFRELSPSMTLTLSVRMINMLKCLTSCCLNSLNDSEYARPFLAQNVI